MYIYIYICYTYITYLPDIIILFVLVCLKGTTCKYCSTNFYGSFFGFVSSKKTNIYLLGTIDEQ